jgi:hypothetical protein
MVFSEEVYAVVGGRYGAGILPLHRRTAAPESLIPIVGPRPEIRNGKQKKRAKKKDDEP